MEHMNNTQPSEMGLTLSFSPDPISAFVFYGLSSGNIEVPRLDLRTDLYNQELLQHRLLRGEVDVARVSVDALAFIASQYFVLSRGMLMACPAFGPKVVARKGLQNSFEALRRRGGLVRVGFDGELSSAGLAFSIAARESGLETEVIVFCRDELETTILENAVDIGVLSLTHESEVAQCGLEVVCDLGQWWLEKMDLPLPLSTSVCRRALSVPVSHAVVAAVDESLRYGLRYRDEAVIFASKFGADRDARNAGEAFRTMVESWETSDAELGERALTAFLQACAAHGLLPYPSDLAFL